MIFHSPLSLSGSVGARGTAAGAYAASGRARWKAPVATAVLWALVAASAVFWVLRLTAPADALAPPAALTRPELAANPAPMARLLGAAPSAVAATPEAASRFVLWGVIADGANRGAALISVDGKPARPWRVGAQLVDGYVLRSISRRAATVGGRGDSASAFTLQMAVRPALNTSGSALGNAAPVRPVQAWVASPPISSGQTPAIAPSPGAVNLPAPMVVQQGGATPAEPP